jgi:hypothetical protein
MIDNHTIVIYGWKIEGSDEIRKIDKKLEKIDEEYLDKFQNIMIDDTMCGNYLYFGAILVNYDAGDDPDPVVINSELITEATSEYNKIIEENPELKKVLKKYTKTPAQLFVFQHIW